MERWASARPREIEREYTAPASPYSLSFASASASSSVSNTITGATGPKTSSRHAACRASRPRGRSAGRTGPRARHPRRARAPASTDRRTMPSTRASCCSLTIGPRSTSSRYGSPRRSRRAFSASRPTYASATLRWTMWRPVAKQTWPWNWNDAKAPAPRPPPRGRRHRGRRRRCCRRARARRASAARRRARRPAGRPPSSP